MLDLLAFAPHPDDVELACGGTLALSASMGYKVGIVDLTEGERGTRGTPGQRARERKKATKTLGLSFRAGLRLPDMGLVRSDAGQLGEVVESLREHTPRVVLAPHWEDRHPDHVEACHLVTNAFFLAGASRFGRGSKPFKAAVLAYYPGSIEFVPSFIVDISSQFETKMKAIGCYASQFSPRAAGEPPTDIAHPHFLEGIKARARYYGIIAGVEHGEPFFMKNPVVTSDPLQLLSL